MKFCDAHFDQLKLAIRDRGLWQLVGNEETLNERIRQEIVELNGGPPPDPKTFDPLYAAITAIYSRSIQCGGLYLMAGDYCPLCELNAHAPADQLPPGHETHAHAWIAGCGDGMLAHARELGLVPRAQ